MSIRDSREMGAVIRMRKGKENKRTMNEVCLEAGAQIPN